jgi:opacity protein-like surface antigen
MSKIVLAAIVAMGFSGIAIADTYGGVGIGQVRLKDSAGGISLDANDAAAKLFGGWRFAENFALELAYLYGGSPEDKIAGVTVEAEPRAVQASVLGTLPITGTVGVYLRAGLLSWKNEFFATDGINSVTAKTDGEDFAWGLGTTFDIGSGAAIRLEYEGADLDGTDVSFISLSGLIRFGAD